MSNFTLGSVDDVVLITLTNIPNSSFSLAQIFDVIGEHKINVDMICQTAPYKDRINLSFTIDANDLPITLNAVGILKDKYTDLLTEISTGNCKFMLYSDILKTQWGIAARLFKVLSENNLNIKLITTSDVEISILLDNTDYGEAFSVLKKEFS